MGQKVIPQSLRLDYLKNWNSNWVEEKKNYSKLFYIDQTLRSFIGKAGKRYDLNINNIYIDKKGKFLNIYINIYNLKHSETQIKKKSFETSVQNYINYLDLSLISKIYLINNTIGNLNIGDLFYKKFKTFKTFPPMAIHFYSFINVSYVAFYTQNAELINTYLVKNLQKNPRHRQYLQNVDKVLNKQFNIFDNCLGYKIELKGRVNGASRSRKISLKSGKAPLTTIKYKIKYNFQEILTPYGICSLKVWLFFKN